eukprot:jgi/Mesvir1/19101/Mv12848-RA.1
MTSKAAAAVAVPDGTAVTLGRASLDCCLPGDRSVSRGHLRVTASKGGRMLVENIGANPICILEAPRSGQVSDHPTTVELPRNTERSNLGVGPRTCRLAFLDAGASRHVRSGDQVSLSLKQPLFVALCLEVKEARGAEASMNCRPGKDSDGLGARKKEGSAGVMDFGLLEEGKEFVPFAKRRCVWQATQQKPGSESPTDEDEEFRPEGSDAPEEEEDEDFEELEEEEEEEEEPPEPDEHGD